jgi:MoxR-like ATPase
MEELVAKFLNAKNEVKKVIIGKDDVIDKVLEAILAKGHVLVEDIPGVGKTTLAMSFSKVMSLKYKRIQFTPDVLPSDVSGFSMYNKQTNQFEYVEGAAMCNLLLADEINRTSPKTQSALLEVMEEGRVTVDGETKEIPKPFTVIATQNPFGSVGTQKLPESQMDRFIVRLSMGYPDHNSEINILKGDAYKGTKMIEAVLSQEDIVSAQKIVDEIKISDELYEFIQALVEATRKNEHISLGLSPRGGIAIVRMAKAKAFMANRDYVVSDDIVEAFYATAAHRIVLSPKSKVDGVNALEVLELLREQIKGVTW